MLTPALPGRSTAAAPAAHLARPPGSRPRSPGRLPATAAAVALLGAVLAGSPWTGPAAARAKDHAAPPPAAGAGEAADEELRFVLVFCRHGVRSPTKDNAAYAPYAVDPWPRWPVAPGQLTPHGRTLLTLLGAYYRADFVRRGLLPDQEPADPRLAFFYADNSARTVESARALAAGLFPGEAEVPVHARPAGQSDPLFYPVKARLGPPDPVLAAAAVRGRIGDDPAALAAACRSPLALLQAVLFNQPAGTAGTAAAAAPPARKTAVADLPVTIGPGEEDGGDLLSFEGAIDRGSTLAEIFQLEYAEGLPEVGWGRLSPEQLSEVSRLHTLKQELYDRTPYPARVLGSNLLRHIAQTLGQAAAGTRRDQALGAPDQRLVVLVGHDNQLAAVAGLLNVSWQIPGFQPNDPSPGGGLVFELRRNRWTGGHSVRVSYVAQTLEQMRQATPLTPAQPPAVSPVFVPDASLPATPGYPCPLERFEQAVNRAADLRFTD